MSLSYLKRHSEDVGSLCYGKCVSPLLVGNCVMTSVCRHFFLASVLLQVCVATAGWSLCYCKCVSPLLVGHCFMASMCRHFLLVRLSHQAVPLSP